MSNTEYSTSTTSLVSHSQTRDYSAAFGALASSYGASGSAPCRSSSKNTSHPNAESNSTSGPKSSPRSSKHAVPKSQDFGSLVNKYGMGAGPRTGSI
ncbi:hypothetical protein CTheo_3074 [Ceratobasidium theobromae]|uniref:Uncharacterized protein n=1 Tax=Ceratobasidium theobromae TaxID=1582974 RepID=A0A5N5QNU2_9AGAM|nr:hypothetical protein CTheo_3074 [Ceratobasidium theobromae]